MSRWFYRFLSLRPAFAYLPVRTPLTDNIPNTKAARTQYDYDNNNYDYDTDTDNW